MIYTQEAVFIHVPKTGGISVTRFLVNALDCPMAMVVPANTKAHARQMAKTSRSAAKLNFVEGVRHRTCSEEAALIKAQGLPMPDLAFAMIRHPVDLLLSYYKHMRKPHIWKRMGMTIDTLKGLPKVAMQTTFDEFCGRKGYRNLSDDEVTNYFRPSGFARLDIVALEHVSDYLTYRFGHHQAFAEQKLEHRNKSAEALSPLGVRDDTVQYIYDTYPGLTRLYREAAGTQPWARP